MKKNVLLASLLLISLGWLNSCKSEKKTEQRVESQSKINVTKEITVGKNKITANILSNNETSKSEITLSLDGKIILQKGFDNVSDFLDPSSFQQTNPIPINKNIILAIGGEYLEIGHFLYVQHENGKLIIKEISSDNASDRNNSTPNTQKIKEISIIE